jgi:hypothetical protein
MTFNPYLPAGNFNPYQHLDALRQQLPGNQQQYMPTQQYQQPYTQQQQPQQMQPQIPNIQLLIQQEIQRQLSSVMPQQQAPMLMPPAQQQPQVSPGQAILSTIGGHLTQSDQIWLSNNLNGLPGFFNTQDGRELIQLAISGYKRHMGIEE